MENSNNNQNLTHTAPTTKRYFEAQSDNEIAVIIKNPEIKNIAQVRKQIGSDAVVAAVAVMVDELQKSVQLTQCMTAFQIQVSAEVICKEYYYLKLDELRICFVNAISGKYGKIFNRVDVAVICEWIEMYIAKRAQVSEKLNQKEIENNNIYEIFQNPVVKEALETALDKIKIRESETKKEPIQRRSPTPFEQLILDEWDELPLHKEGPLKVYDMFVDKNTTTTFICDFTTYRKKRYQEIIEQHNSEDNE